MKSWASLLTLLLLPTNLLARETVLVKYDELPQRVQKNSKEVKAAEFLKEASAARQGYQARARYPKLDLESGLRGVREVDGSGESAPFFKVEGSVNLYRGNRDALKDTLQDKETAIRSEEAQLVFRNQLGLAREIFVKLASVRELKNAWTEAVQVASAKKKSSRVKVNAGLTTNTDLLEFELHEAALKREKRNLDKEEHELSNKLRILLGLPEDANISLDRAFAHPPEPKEGDYKLAAGTHPAVRKLSLQAEQAQMIAGSSVTQWTPDVNLFASYEEFLQGTQEEPGSLPKRDFAAGIRLSIPLGDNLSVQNEASAKRLEASAYELQKQHSTQQIEAVYHEHLHDMKVLHDLIHDSDEQLQKARKYLKQTSEEYERGVRSGADVLEASRTLYRTQVENIQLVFDYYLAELALRRLTSNEQHTAPAS
ncbi:MAG TPA: TolC family protein [Oligoflexus sp.]|uniref:TolC family protein n=1 Tax=Oligoflexus sp. TaxID=1971216 RepID=UPI002D7E6B53|nr:TolC family protein [Oligoflexus sp.]HET9240109.1 TolC family protein [Oligoflexus sp.]